ncbi:hypothetical protein [Paracnuella aquatica]|uniref:hypothetical protein n=1 Tax=Paracnuella aquatica TaxID=2268757 RepID=UPI000DEF7B1E|nr:hypothetical protein [Paracnuella aquatica]RPD43494.1 hypothetical protein DRJ53_19830 [Paracnuella aquatica]
MKALTTTRPSKATAPQDTLRLLLEQIEGQCAAWGIFPFYGLIGEEDPIMAVWSKDDPEEGDWQAFLQLFRATGAKILHLSTFPYTVPEERTAAFLEQALPQMNKEDRQEFLAAHAHLKHRVGHLAALDLIFLHEGTYYRYEVLSEWYSAFMLVSSNIANFNPGEEAWDEDDGDEE